MRVYANDQVCAFRFTLAEWGSFSNFQSLAVPIAAGPWTFFTSEAVYQAAKFGARPDVQRRIAEAPTAREAAAIGRTPGLGIDAGWNAQRVAVMRWVLRMKREANQAEIDAVLAATGDRPIVEVSTRDPWWGARPVADRNPVISQEAAARRDALIEKLASLPPVPAALDQIVQHFGHEAVAEVTGRSRRVLKVTDARGERLALRSRPASANLAETAAFMDRTKRILVFSMAGGTGRSYHADLSAGNTERRIHYLLEPGWRADQAIQGLGRTHRTHQASAPLFRPVTTDVKGEKRFIATIARRLDSLGAITRGQRDSQTAMGGDATLFRESDNLESLYRTGFVARRSAEDLAPLRQLEAIVRDIALSHPG